MYMNMITYQNNQSFGPSDMVLPPQGLHTLPHTSTQQTHAHLSNTRVHEYVCHVQKLSRLARRKWCCRLDIALVPCYQARGQQRIGEMRIVKLLSPISTSRYKVWTNSAFKQCRCLCVFVREKDIYIYTLYVCIYIHRCHPYFAARSKSGLASASAFFQPNLRRARKGGVGVSR